MDTTKHHMDTTKQHMDTTKQHMDTTKQHMDTTKHRKRNKRRKWKKIEIKPDGNCLFRSIAFFQQEDHVLVRGMIVAYVSTNWDFFSQFLDPGYYDGHIFRDQEEYFDHMLMDGKHGTQVEIMAAAHLFGYRINIFTPENHDEPRNVLGEENEINIHFEYEPMGNTGHYSVLIPQTDQTVEPGICDSPQTQNIEMLEDLMVVEDLVSVEQMRSPISVPQNVETVEPTRIVVSAQKRTHSTTSIEKRLQDGFKRKMVMNLLQSLGKAKSKKDELLSGKRRKTMSSAHLQCESPSNTELSEFTSTHVTTSYLQHELPSGNDFVQESIIRRNDDCLSIPPTEEMPPPIRENEVLSEPHNSKFEAKKKKTIGARRVSTKSKLSNLAKARAVKRDSSSSIDSFNSNDSSTPVVHDVATEAVTKNCSEICNIDSPTLSLVVQDSAYHILPTPKQGSEKDTSQHQLVVEPEGILQSQKIEGNRIVDPVYMFEQYQNFPHRPYFNCGIKDMTVISELRYGFKSTIQVRCNVCNEQVNIHCIREVKDEMDLNTAAVGGTILAGVGHTALEKVMTKMNVPTMSSSTYAHHTEVLGSFFEKTATKAMKAAAEDEANIAKKAGRVGKDGIPHIAVTADGSWCKRSYGIQYNSLGGVGAIIGCATNKVLFIGVKNKYCSLCKMATNKNTTPREHVCYQNWGSTQSSTAMEAAAIAEGFKSSVEMHGLRYTDLIADGDSNVHNTIVKLDPYKGMANVRKIECSNHLFRNYCRKLTLLAKSSSKYNKDMIAAKKVLGGGILRLRTGITKAMKHHAANGINNENIKSLRSDIINAPYHVFGDHKNCASYFCKPDVTRKKKETNWVSKFQKVKIFHEIQVITKVLAEHSKSLIHNLTNNAVENYNSILNTLIGSKRVNFTSRGSYLFRNYAATVSCNTGLPFYNTHKVIFEKSPAMIAKKLELALRKKIVDKAKRRKNNPAFRKKLFKSTNASTDKYYGENAEKQDLDLKTYKKRVKAFWDELVENHTRKDEIQDLTKAQADCDLWKNLRKNYITASNFAAVCKCRVNTSTAGKVKAILYSGDIDVPATRYGKRNEPLVKKILCEKFEPIEEMGLCIHNQHIFIAASPDGYLPQSEMLVEIKCPFSCANITPEEGIRLKKITFWKQNEENGQFEVNKKDKYFFQVQGQLQVANKQKCLFVVWTPKGMKTEVIEKDDEFWEKHMLQKLTSFYMNCLLPEIIDPRVTRSMKIRNVFIDGVVVETEEQPLAEGCSPLKEPSQNCDPSQS